MNQIKAAQDLRESDVQDMMKSFEAGGVPQNRWGKAIEYGMKVRDAEGRYDVPTKDIIDIAISDFRKACNMGLQEGCDNLQKALSQREK